MAMTAVAAPSWNESPLMDSHYKLANWTWARTTPLRFLFC